MKFFLFALAGLAAAIPSTEKRASRHLHRHLQHIKHDIPSVPTPSWEHHADSYEVPAAYSSTSTPPPAPTSTPAPVVTLAPAPTTFAVVTTKAAVITKAKAPDTTSTWTSSKPAKTATASDDDGAACPVIYTAQCCEVDVLGGPVGLTCVQPEFYPSSKANLYKQCNKIGMTANCCLLPAGGDSLICNMP